MPMFSRALFVLVVLAGAPGCTTLLSKDIVLAPNMKDERRQVGDAPDEQLADQFIARQVRVDVGPPRASLSAWIVEAWSVTVDARLQERVTGPDGDDPAFVEQLREVYGRTKGERVELTLLNGAILEPMEHSAAGGNRKLGYQFGMITSWRGMPRPNPRRRARLPKGTIFVLHGIGDRKDKVPYLLWARVLAQAGYRAVLVDLRGHGRSTGRYMSYGVHESRDMRQLLDAFEEQGLVYGPVGVWGISYGGATAIQWAAIDSRVRAVVALEPFATLRAAVRDFAPVVLGGWSFLAPRPVLRAATNAAAALAGFDPDDASPLAAMPHVAGRVLLMHGTADRHLPPRHSERLHAAAPDRSELYLVEGDGHLTLWVRHLAEVRPRVTEFFDRHLGVDGAATRPAVAGAAGRD